MAKGTDMTIRTLAFLHGYPPVWSMGGEISTHRTLQVLDDVIVMTHTPDSYEIDGVLVQGFLSKESNHVRDEIMDALITYEPDVVYTHSSMSAQAVRAARSLDIPTILAVHAPPRFGTDLRYAWSKASARLYNTHSARTNWNDPKGWVLHPPVGKPREGLSRGDALTLTSSLLNKGADKVLALAAQWTDRRFIIVESPAHATHGDIDFWRQAAKLSNVEVWPRLHPDRMFTLWAETRTLLVPSRYETYGLSAVEAAWHGIPSVHVETPDVLEGIGVAARLITTRTTDLADAILDVDRNHEYWSKKAFARAQELAVREELELDLFVEKVKRLV